MYGRIEGKGKGILQHHQIIAEFEAIPEENRKKLLDGAFGEVLRSAQVILIILVSNLQVICMANVRSFLMYFC